MSIIESSRFRPGPDETTERNEVTRPGIAPPRYDEDTISLIDLLAVVLRHRSLILGGTLVAALITAALLFLAPLAGFSILPPVEYTAQQRILLDPLPPEVDGYLGVDVPATVMAIVNDPRIVGEVYRPFDTSDAAGRTEEGYLSVIRDNVIGTRFIGEWDGDTRMLSLNFTAERTDDAQALIDAFVIALRTETGGRLQSRLDEASETLDTALVETTEDLSVAVEAVLQDIDGAVAPADADLFLNAVNREAETAVRALSDKRQALTVLQNLQEDVGALFTPVGEVTVYEEERASRSMILIITVITAFFLTVFLAFVLEYISRVREEPEEMAKLHSAWHRR